MKYQLFISEDYINSVDGVKRWITDYARRNNIGFERKEIESKFIGQIDGYEIVLTFKSDHQLTCFARNGNKNFPYFEFL